MVFSSRNRAVTVKREARGAPADLSSAPADLPSAPS
jgi:hypothetical protein